MPSSTDQTQLQSSNLPQPTQTAQATPNQGPLPSWREITDGVNSGSWAIVLVLGVLVVVGRKAFSKYLDAQISLLDAMKVNIVSNTTTIEEIKTHDQISGGKLDQLIKSVDELHEKSGETLEVLRSLQIVSPKRNWFNR